MGRDLVGIIEMRTEMANFHESIFRSYHILAYAKDLLRRNTPPDVVLEIIESLERPRQKEEDKELVGEEA